MPHTRSCKIVLATATLGLLLGAFGLVNAQSTSPVCNGGSVSGTVRSFSFAGSTSQYITTSGCVEPNPTPGWRPPLSLAISTDYFVLVNTTRTNADKPPNYVAPIFTLTGGQTIFSHQQNSNLMTGIFVQGFDTSGSSLASLDQYPPFTMTVQNCFFGSNNVYFNGLYNSNGGVALTGALPPNSVVTLSNNTFIGAIGTAYGNNNYGSQWLNTWPGVTNVLASNALCSLCLVDLALLGTSARLIVTNNTFPFFFDSWYTTTGYVYSNQLLLQGASVTVSDNVFRAFDSNQNPKAYRQGQPCAQVLFPSVKFLTKSSEPESAKGAAAINVMRNDIRISVATSSGNIGYYGGTQQTLISTSPATIAINYTMPGGLPTPPPTGYFLTGGNISVYENFVTGLWQNGGNPNNNNNISCNAAFNFSVIQDPDTAYSLPVVLRVANNQVYGQPQYPFIFSLVTSRKTAGSVFEIRGNYYQAASPSGVTYGGQGYNIVYIVNQQGKVRFATVRFDNLTLYDDATVAMANNMYNITFQLGANYVPVAFQLPPWQGLSFFPFILGPRAGFLLSNNYVGVESFDDTIYPREVLNQMASLPQLTSQFAPATTVFAEAVWQQNLAKVGCFTCGGCRGTLALSNTASKWCTASQRWASLRYNTTVLPLASNGAGDPRKAIKWPVNMICPPPLARLD